MLQRLEIPAALDGRVWRYTSEASANRRHRHVELELNLVTHGRGVYLLGHRRYTIARGDLLWLFPAQEHVLIEQSSEFAMWVAVFRRRAVRRNAVDAAARPLLQRSCDADTCRRLHGHDLLRIEDLLQELSAATDQAALLNAGLGYGLLQAWAAFRRAQEVPVDALHPAVERAARVIRDEEDCGSLEQLAHRVGLSAARLSRLFKSQTGSTLVDFRNRQRLERFRQIHAADENSTLLEAALAAGFGSYPQFHRVFRRQMGRSPREHLDKGQR